MNRWRFWFLVARGVGRVGCCRYDLVTACASVGSSDDTAQSGILSTFAYLCYKQAAETDPLAYDAVRVASRRESQEDKMLERDGKGRERAREALVPVPAKVFGGLEALPYHIIWVLETCRSNLRTPAVRVTWCLRDRPVW